MVVGVIAAVPGNTVVNDEAFAGDEMIDAKAEVTAAILDEKPGLVLFEAELEMEDAVRVHVGVVCMTTTLVETVPTQLEVVVLFDV